MIRVSCILYIINDVISIKTYFPIHKKFVNPAMTKTHIMFVFSILSRKSLQAIVLIHVTTYVLKFKWRGGELNPGPLAPQAKSLTTRPPTLPHTNTCILCLFRSYFDLNVWKKNWTKTI